MKWLSGLWGSKQPEKARPQETKTVVKVDRDPRLKAAEAEARRRFPEFAAAFEQRAGSGFAVKAQLSANGSQEHIWLKVHSVTTASIAGDLVNSPVNLGELKLGSRVDVALGQVEDWIFDRDGKREGSFTKPVLLQMEKERRGGD